MTIQVVLFTVMLFGAIGMVIDFGRAYSAHSQMQSYIDQVALAAAAELDGRTAYTDGGGNAVPDAITRATAAANAVTKSSLFTQGGGNFQIAQLVFLSDAPTDASGNFDYALVTGGTLTTTNPALAKFVVAIAQQASVRASLLDISIGGLGSSIGQIPIGTFAVATSRQVTCEGLSTLVMCNPFENDPSQSLESVLQDATGYRLKLTASTALGLTTTASEIGVGLIKNPVSILGTDSGACEDTANLPGYTGQTGAALEDLRDKCLLAVVDTGLSCVNDELVVKEAPPPTVVTGLDVIFDIYDDEMASILTSDPTLATGLNRSTYFYPDIAAVHGNIRRDEITDYYAAYNAEIDASTAYTASQKTALKTLNNNRRNLLLTRYPGDSNPASRLNHIPIAPAEHGPIQSPPCFATSCTGTGAPHGAIYDSDIQPLDYATSYYTPTVAARSAAAGLTGYDATTVTGTAATFYQFYSLYERTEAALQTYAATNGKDWNPPADSPDAGLIDNFFVRTWPDNFSNAYPGVDMTAKERRRVRMAVVNCAAKESHDAGDGLQSYKVEVEDVVDVFLTRAPKVTACTTTYTSTTDPQGMLPCENGDITAAELHVEYIGSVQDNLQVSRSRTYAVLVH